MASRWFCCMPRGPVTIWLFLPLPTSRTSTPSTMIGTMFQTRWVYCCIFMLMLQVLNVIWFIAAPLTSDHLQADLRSSLGDGGYIVFGVILFVWELLPTSLVVFFFRVRRPPQERVSLPAGLGHMTLAATWTCESFFVGYQLSLNIQ